MAQDFTYPRVAGDYYVQAIHSVYPTLRDGVDFSVARDSPGGTYTITDTTFGTIIDQAKIEEVADVMFSRDPYAGYTPPEPKLTSISPTSMASMSGTVVVTATGTRFTDQSDIYVGPDLCTTNFVSATSINAGVDTDSLTAGTVPVVVKTPGFSDTAAQNLTVT